MLFGNRRSSITETVVIAFAIIGFVTVCLHVYGPNKDSGNVTQIQVQGRGEDKKERKHFQKHEQTQERMDYMQHILDLIEPPSKLPYNLSRPKVVNTSPGQAQIVDKLLNGKTNGFFVDSGSADGEIINNSLFFERQRNWTGLLMEPNPRNYRKLKSKHRKANVMNACLSVEKKPMKVPFATGSNANLGRILKSCDSLKPGKGDCILVQCFPLYDVLLALNQLHVDYFSLDVEGAELGILETIPFDKVDIKTLSIEHNRWPGGKKALKTYMNEKGYDCVGEITGIPVAPDLIFMKRDTN